MKIKLKKLIRTIFMTTVMTVLSVISAVSVSAADINQDEAYKLAEAMMSEYIYARSIYSLHDFSKYTSLENLVEYFDSIVSEIQESGAPIVDETYTANVTSSSFKDLGDCAMVCVSAVESCNNGESSSGDSAYVLIAKSENGLEIRDFYLSENGYEWRFRGADYQFGNPDYWLDSPKIEAVLERARAERKIGFNVICEQSQRKLAEQYAMEDMGTASIDEPDAVDSITLNKDNIATWARDNCTKESPTSAIPGVEYCDMSQWNNYDDPNGKKNWDCTNFASHALIAGGAIMNSSSWYYNSSSSRSSSWASVDKFYEFLTTNKDTGPFGKSVTYMDLNNGLYIFNEGDIIQFDVDDDDTSWKHTTIITGFTDLGNGKLRAKVSGRSAALSKYQQNNYDIEKVKKDRGYTRARVIILKGCRE